MSRTSVQLDRGNAFVAFPSSTGYGSSNIKTASYQNDVVAQLRERSKEDEIQHWDESSTASISEHSNRISIFSSPIIIRLASQCCLSDRKPIPVTLRQFLWVSAHILGLPTPTFTFFRKDQNYSLKYKSCHNPPCIFRMSGHRRFHSSIYMNSEFKQGYQGIVHNVFSRRGLPAPWFLFI